MDAKDCKPIIDYPCPWTYKVIGRDLGALKEAIAEVVGGSAHTIAVSRSSRGGAYYCLNVEMTVETEADRLDLYERFCRHPAIVIVM
jgi:uncharacterized protein